MFLSEVELSKRAREIVGKAMGSESFVHKDTLKCISLAARDYLTQFLEGIVRITGNDVRVWSDNSLSLLNDYSPSTHTTRPVCMLRASTQSSWLFSKRCVALLKIHNLMYLPCGQYDRAQTGADKSQSVQAASKRKRGDDDEESAGSESSTRRKIRLGSLM